MKTEKKLVSVSLLIFTLFLLVSFSKSFQEKWEAPSSADKIINPLKNDVNAAASGKKLYKVLCSVCHGLKGKGDGMGGTVLKPKPTDLTSAAFHLQTDGAIFWKIQEGRAPMASYKTSIPEKNRWEIINYIRALKK